MTEADERTALTHVIFAGGPMDGYRMPCEGWTREQMEIGVAHISPRSVYGDIGGRSLYGPPEDADPLTCETWVWEGDTA